MAKVYIFRNYDADELEKNINEFLADKELVDIKINTVPENDVLNGFRLWTTAVVIYEEKHNPLAHPESYVDDVMSMICDMTDAQITKLTSEITSYVDSPIEYRMSRKRGKS